MIQLILYIIITAVFIYALKKLEIFYKTKGFWKMVIPSAKTLSKWWPEDYITSRMLFPDAGIERLVTAEIVKDGNKETFKFEEGRYNIQGGTAFYNPKLKRNIKTYKKDCPEPLKLTFDDKSFYLTANSGEYSDAITSGLVKALYLAQKKDYIMLILIMVFGTLIISGYNSWRMEELYSGIAQVYGKLAGLTP